MLQVAQRFLEAGFVVTVLGEELPRLIVGEAVLRGVGAAVAGLVLATGVKMAVSLGRTPRALGFLLATVTAIAVLRWPLVPVLVTLIPLSVLVVWIRRA